MLFLGLVVPYASGFIQWAANEGFFPIRPAIYLILVSALSLALTLPAHPNLTWTSLAIVVLLTFYLLDLIAFGRFTPPGGVGEQISSYGSFIVQVATMACIIGVMHRLKLTAPYLIASALIIVLCSGSAVAEMFGFYKFTDDPGRAAGFRIDANDACIAITIALAVFLTVSKKPLWSFAMIGIALVGCIVTLSRSGMIGLTVVTGLYLVAEFRRNPRAVLRLSLVALPILIAGGAWLLQNLASENKGDADVSSRMSAMYGGDFSKLASSERLKDLTDAIEAIIDKPVFGHGAGAGSLQWRPHNQLVSIWVDGGFFAAVLYAAILASICLKTIRANFRGLPVVAGLLVFVPFSQSIIFDAGYWLAALFILLLNSRRIFCLQLHRPEPTDDLALRRRVTL